MHWAGALLLLALSVLERLYISEQQGSGHFLGNTLSSHISLGCGIYLLVSWTCDPAGTDHARLRGAKLTSGLHLSTSDVLAQLPSEVTTMDDDEVEGHMRIARRRQQEQRELGRSTIAVAKAT